MTEQKFHTIATTDFELFYNAWLPKVKTAVYQSGFHDEHAEDLVQDIFSDLARGKYLDKYDPERATFATYIWGHIQVRIRGRKRDLWKRGQREFTSDMTDSMHDSPIIDHALEETELTLALESVYNELERLPATETKNLARLFKDIVQMVNETGMFSQADLAKKYGYSRQAIGYQIADLAKTEAIRKLKLELQSS